MAMMGNFEKLKLTFLETKLENYETSSKFNGTPVSLIILCLRNMFRNLKLPVLRRDHKIN